MVERGSKTAVVRNVFLHYAGLKNIEYRTTNIQPACRLTGIEVKDMTKKELLHEYKQKVFRMGVFQIRNTVNNKILVESSPNLDAIWNRHRLELKFGSHRNLVLQADWAAHGEENFVYEILEELNQSKAAANKLDPTKEIKLLEQLYLDELQPFEEKGYNRKPK